MALWSDVRIICYFIYLLHLLIWTVKATVRITPSVLRFEHFMIFSHVVRRTNRVLFHVFDALMHSSDYYGSLVRRTNHMLFHIVAAFIDMG